MKHREQSVFLFLSGNLPFHGEQGWSQGLGERTHSTKVTSDPQKLEFDLESPFVCSLLKYFY